MKSTQFYPEKIKASTLSGTVPDNNLVVASETELGVVSVDGNTIKADSSGIISLNRDGTTIAGDVTGSLSNSVLSSINGHTITITGGDTPYSLSFSLYGNSTVGLPSKGLLVSRGIMIRGTRLESKSTSGTAIQMCGFGSSLSFTPTTTGTVRVRISVVTKCSTAPAVVEIYGRYGTGTAPINGASDTGTALFSSYLPAGCTSTSDFIYQTVEATLSSLTTGTTYWLDIATKNQTGSYTQDVFISYYEIEEYV